MNDFSSFHFSVHKNDDINSIFLSRENYFCTLYLQFERFVFYAFPKILSDITVAFEIAEYYSSLRLLCPGFLYPFVQRRSIIETHSAPRGEELVAETLGLERSSRNQLSRISYLSSFENTFVKTHKTYETAT